MDPILAHAPQMNYGPGRLWDTWKMYLFSYSGSVPEAAWGAVEYVEDVQVGFYLTPPFISYLFQDDPALQKQEDVVDVEEPILLLLLSTTNSAHSLCELLSFILFYRGLSSPMRVGVNTHIVNHMPYLHQLLLQFIPEDRILYMDGERVHWLRKAWLRRNVHMNSCKDYKNVPFTRSDDILRFSDLQNITSYFVEDPTLLNQKAAEIFASYAQGHALADRVMLVKTRSDANLTSPQRAMEVTPDVKEMITASGIKVVSIGDFSDINEYLATIYGAKIFITSYGGAACTNRFFCSPSARVILLANRHYAEEYRYPLKDSALSIPSAPADLSEFWHLRSSHLFPVAEQTVILDHNDVITEADARRIIALASQ